MLRQKADASVGVSPAQSIAFQTRNASRATQLQATRGATIPLRPRALGEKSPRGNCPLGDESPPAMRVDWQTQTVFAEEQRRIAGIGLG